MVREFKENVHFNPLTSMIAYFMEDPKKREERFANHVQFSSAMCNTVVERLNTPMATDKSFSIRAQRSVPRNQVTTQTSGDLQCGNSLDSIIAFHEKL
mmetsp:Transcript_12329/g.16637  ORF Transcript_12329/g.16637 Transcript_12329/m.16637 type:complete len:98 (+) Transcript_12329:84-377(+)